MNKKPLEAQPWQPGVDPKVPPSPAVLTALARFTAGFGRRLTYMAPHDARLACAMHETQSLPYAELADTWALGSLLHVIRVRGIGAPGLLVLGPSLVDALTDVLLGGGGRAGESNQQGELGPVGCRLAWRVAQTAMAELELAFQTLAAGEFHLGRQETAFTAAAIMAPEECAFVATFFVNVGGVAHRLHLALPAGALARLKPQRPADVAVNGSVARLLEAAVVEAVAVLGEADCAAGIVAGLTVGDVLGLGRADALAELRVAGVTRHYGKPAVHGDRRVLHLVKAG